MGTGSPSAGIRLGAALRAEKRQTRYFFLKVIVLNLKRRRRELAGVGVGGYMKMTV